MRDVTEASEEVLWTVGFAVVPAALLAVAVRLVRRRIA
jgi:hypothetical protein